MKEFKADKKGKLFPETICSDESVFFHGTHINNAKSIESNGIQRPRYPKSVLELIEEYREISTTLGLSHALSTYEKTYQNKANIVFVTKTCSQAAGYIRGVSGEEITTLRISINNLNLLIQNPEHLKKKIREKEKKVEKARWDEKDFYQKSLEAFQNIHQYKPLLDKSMSIMETYPHLFKEPDSLGIVYAIKGKDLSFENQDWEGYSTDSIPVKSIFAKSTFKLNVQMISSCRVCKKKELGL